MKINFIKKYFCKSLLHNNSTIPLSNKNIFLMRKFENARNKEINLKLKSCQYIFQVFWSDFIHISFLNKNFNNSNLKTNLDFTNVDNENTYTVFQNENDFFSFNDDTNEKKINFIEEEKDIKIENQNYNSNDELITIARIPQEINLNITAESGIKFINPGDTKLISDKNIKIQYTEIEIQKINTMFNFEAKRLRAEYFYLNAANRRLSVIIKSHLETKNIDFSILNSSTVRIKKLGVVNEGKITLNNSDCEIRSIYAPKGERALDFEIENTKILIGSIQGKIKIHANKKCKIIIENIESENFIINAENDENSELEIFVNNINSNSNFLLNVKQTKIHLFLNSDYKFNIKHNQKMILNEENEGPIIKINSAHNPEITQLSSWDYMKRKIMNKISKKE